MLLQPLLYALGIDSLEKASMLNLPGAPRGANFSNGGHCPSLPCSRSCCDVPQQGGKIKTVPLRPCQIAVRCRQRDHQLLVKLPFASDLASRFLSFCPAMTTAHSGQENRSFPVGDPGKISLCTAAWVLPDHSLSSSSVWPRASRGAGDRCLPSRGSQLQEGGSYANRQ